MGNFIGSPFDPHPRGPSLIQELAAALERGMKPKATPRKRPSRAKAKA